ncbi:kinase domain-containing protein [Favolaschia claudopus]|uniref:Kinase domain-containing protein n=1 Tax=Favolaschia claudopus TaxID=2862362 RepID=A0AAW0D0D0_9AGAR
MHSGLPSFLSSRTTLIDTYASFEHTTHSHSSISFVAQPSSSSSTHVLRTTVLEWVEKQWMDDLTLPKYFIAHAFSLPLSLSPIQINDIQIVVQQWGRWDAVESLANYRSVVKILFEIIKNGLIPDARWISHVVAEEIFRCLSQDLIVIHDQLVAISRNHTSNKAFLASRGDCAQQLLDLLQDVLDAFPQSASRPGLCKALVRLSRASDRVPTCFPLTELQVVGQQVAAGAFGDIWRGIVRGQSVSIKVVRLFRDAQVRAAIQEFGREALIWRQLSHPNLLPFFGLYYLETRICLVSPWMSNGHILQFLENAPPGTDRLSLMLDVAMGVEYLHGMCVVHADLKGSNILVTPSLRACVADFGLSSIVDSMSLRFTHSTASFRGGGTARYQARELLLNDMRPHYGSDILTGLLPFFEYSMDAQVIFRVLEGFHPTRPETIRFEDDLWVLLRECWDVLPSARPTASQIVQRLIAPIGAKKADLTRDWDEIVSSRGRRALQYWPLLPSVTEIERRVFGNGEYCYFIILYVDLFAPKRSPKVWSLAVFIIVIELRTVCSACYPEASRDLVSSETPNSGDETSNELLSPSLSVYEVFQTDWHRTGILVPDVAVTYEEHAPFLWTLESTSIPLSCLEGDHSGHWNADMQRQIRIYVPSVHHTDPSVQPHRRSAAPEPRRSPTPNNFPALWENYKQMLAHPSIGNSAATSYGTSLRHNNVQFPSTTFVLPKTDHLFSPHEGGSDSLTSTPELDWTSATPESVCASEYTPNDSMSSDFPLIASTSDADEYLGPEMKLYDSSRQIPLYLF